MIDIPKFESIYSEKLSDHVSISEQISNRSKTIGDFGDAALQAIQQNFYDLAYYRCRNADDCIAWLDENKDNLPKITNDLLTNVEPEWLPIPGMYGGFSYGLIERDNEPLLVADSWVRVVGGSGQTHEITPTSVTIVAEGYV
ncbi:MAG: hypothetical protein ACREGE_00665 [Candidatus Microsaccharimonas sp.]